MLRLFVCCFHPLTEYLNSGDRLWNRYWNFSKASASEKRKKTPEIREFNNIANISCFACCTTGQVFCEESPGNVCIDTNRKEFSFHESLDCQWCIIACHRYYGAKMRYYPEFHTPMTRKFEPRDLYILAVINGNFFNYNYNYEYFWGTFSL